ncbi:MAG TPA: hypothetical protein VJ754_09915, partial [Anaerolineae bacterium]|nr:hypothetical protein [Anaerolineae bacterium]
SRDTTPEGWSGAKGVTEFAYSSEGVPSYRLWIAPLQWTGSPQASGGATHVGRSACFQFFDRSTTDTAWPSARSDVLRLFDLHP